MQMQYTHSSLVNEAQMHMSFAHLEPYIKELRQFIASGNQDIREAFIHLPFDQTQIDNSLELLETFHISEVKYVFVIGIGGSSLGAKAVYDAFTSFTEQTQNARHSQNMVPKLYFVDTINPQQLKEIRTFIKERVQHPKDVLFCVISKSGSTLETLLNASMITNQVLEISKEYMKRLVIITDAGTKLWKLAKEYHIPLLEHPPYVGGRFSVFSVVGLFVLACAGIDIKQFVKGARAALEGCLVEDIHKNDAALTAALLHYYHSQQIRIHNHFYFHSQLKSIGDWYKQLLCESTGKEYDENGKQIFAGITAMTSIATTDLHSVAQLLLAGPRDKFTTFIWLKNTLDLEIPKENFLSPLLEDIDQHSLRDVLLSIYEGVKAVYLKKELPFMEYVLEEINAFELGGFMQTQMMSIAYIGKLMNINVFDQPHVESYKQEARKFLQNHK